jgi:hypothetical protein
MMAMDALVREDGRCCSTPAGLPGWGRKPDGGTMALSLTPTLIAEVCQRIQAGAFEQVAAESLGIPYATFQDWLRRGQQPRARRLYRRLADEVRQARGHARLMAEMQLRKEDAKAWLLNGPGRASNDQEGWGAASRERQTAEKMRQADQLEAYAFDLCAVLLEALTPYPEARAAAAQAVAGCHFPAV